ncbi:type I-B CRISPR-associated protein Cas8b1/Cst1 [Caloranaerobacter ferrireducens]|uniref:type I-B CRISPR-associated protein Cas8b1/Cst1 n=1 Tax=Caloranaerobacter ferrireducens TaxID=1323370 RepID=UPI00159F0195|nr:type I-B CRISPR-associated protein Cas8b1/Cst1 [Caloranaerobacter ferrireducens]
MRILKKAGRYNELNIEDNFIEFDSCLLENFHKYYFNYFLERYDIYKRESKKVDIYLQIGKKEEKYKDAVEWIKNVVGNNRNKVKGKFEDKSIELKFNELYSQLGKLKKHINYKQLEDLVEEFKVLMETEEVNEKLTLNYFRSILSTHFFGQASFLQKGCSSKSLVEQSAIMFKDYIKPILEEVRLYNKIEKIKDIKEFGEFIDQELKNKNNSKFYLKILKYVKKNVLKKGIELEKIKEYLFNNFGHCSIWEEYIASTDYTEAIFIPLAVSNTNAQNFMWNLNTSYPISNLIKFILLCSPAGTTDMKNNYFGFVNMDASVNELYRVNENFMSMKDEENPFESLVYDILSEATKKSVWTLQNILFIEFSANYDAKNCNLKYFNIPKNIAKYFKNYSKKDLVLIYDKKFKGNLVNYILNNKDMKYLIQDKLRENIKNSYKDSYDCFLATRARFTLKKVIKGCEEVDSSKLWVIYKSGQDLNSYFKEKESENKIQGIAYRLLNASKSGNKKEFMDSLLRIFMAAGKEVPSLFLNVMHEKDLDFETVAHSFISGLISNSNREVKGDY